MRSLPDIWEQRLVEHPLTAAQTWTNVAVTYDGSMLRLYVNGSEVASQAVTGTLRDVRDSYAQGTYLTIDDVRIYSRALSASELWADLLGSVDVTAPMVISLRSPLDGAVGVATTPITATFSHVLAEATLTGSTFELCDGVSAVVPATVSYNSSTHVASLTPTNALSAVTTYTVRVIGGTGGVRDLTGSGLAGDVTWTFKTAAGANHPVAAYAFSESAGTTTADLSGHHLPHHLASSRCGHHFFRSTSRVTSISRCDSASNFFNRVFSISSSFSRLASDTLMPPNLLRHR